MAQKGKEMEVSDVIQSIACTVLLLAHTYLIVLTMRTNNEEEEGPVVSSFKFGFGR